jgi:hypothetical protein
MQMKILVSYVMLIALTLLLSSCCSNKVVLKDPVPLTSSSTDWLPYQSNQLLVFKNDSNNQNTIKISDYVHENSAEYKKECSQSPCESIDVMLKLLNDSSLNIGIGIQDGMVNFYFNEKQTEFYEVGNYFHTMEPNDRYYATDTIDGIPYKDVIFLKRENHVGQIEVTEMYYVKTVGLIKYMTSDSVVWRKI